MLVGPLIAQPPLAPFINAFTAALNHADIMGNKRLYFPTGVEHDGSIKYDSQRIRYAALADLSTGSCRSARDIYKDVDPIPSGNPIYLQEVSYMERAFDQRVGGIVAVLMHTRILSGETLKDFDAILDRIEVLDGRSLKEIVALSKGGGAKSDSVLSDESFLYSVAEALNYSANVHLRPGSGAGQHVVASLFLAASMLAMTAGRLGGEFLAIHCLKRSSACYSEAGLYVAAALSSEMAAQYEASLSHKKNAGNEAHAVSAQNWLLAAEEMMERKDRAVSVALYRGILSALIYKGGEMKDVIGRLHNLAARYYTSKGMHIAAGDEHLREAFAKLRHFSEVPKHWADLGDIIDKSIESYSMGGDPRSLGILLENLKSTAENEANSATVELDPLNKLFAESESDVDLLLQRSRARLRHGDFEGAREDLEKAIEIEPHSPLIMSELGLFYHHASMFYAQSGKHEDMLRLFGLARSHINDAFKLVEVGREADPLLIARSAAIEAAQGHLKEASAALNTAHVLAPEDKDIADYLAAVGDLKKLTRIE